MERREICLERMAMQAAVQSERMGVACALGAALVGFGCATYLVSTGHGMEGTRHDALQQVELALASVEWLEDRQIRRESQNR